MLFMRLQFNIVCMVNSAVIKADLCTTCRISSSQNMLASSERKIWWTQNQLRVKPHTLLFPHRRINKMNIFFSFLEMFIFVSFPCGGCAGRCLGIITYAAVLQLSGMFTLLPPLSIPCSVHPGPGKCCW